MLCLFLPGVEDGILFYCIYSLVKGGRRSPKKKRGKNKCDLPGGERKDEPSCQVQTPIRPRWHNLLGRMEKKKYTVRAHSVRRFKIVPAFSDRRKPLYHALCGLHSMMETLCMKAISGTRASAGSATYFYSQVDYLHVI